ncbi:hypothetical protein E2C01_033999 [Portunus trituberculatus]|uniref:Uncharacterized protein n=1 Tax=Portunus trituberculatus TaxID=210409 RepID=A0A5B7F1M7_PORTR|nr:hypothetical protein [Portunus trituberculatus]
MAIRDTIVTETNGGLEYYCKGVFMFQRRKNQYEKNTISGERDKVYEGQIFEKQDHLFAENQYLKVKCGELENTVKVNNEMRITLEEIKEENSALTEKCVDYEVALETLNKKVDKEKVSLQRWLSSKYKKKQRIQ